MGYRARSLSTSLSLRDFDAIKIHVTDPCVEARVCFVKGVLVMASSIPHGARSTANQVLAGVDLTRKWILVTGCNEEIGFETMNALATNGAHVFGLANSLANARNACDQIGPRATPVVCDLTDLDSIAAAAEMIRGLQVSLDAIIANSEVASPPVLHTRYGVELQFLSNHIGHFALVNQLLNLVRNGTGPAQGRFASLARGEINGATIHEIGEPGSGNRSAACGEPLCHRNYRRVLVGLSGREGESTFE
jgi:hypothetical protein